jgi:parallel beta-helix repeat protein
MRKEIVAVICFSVFSTLLFPVSYVLAWSNGGFSDDPSNPKYGTHDWIAEHALDWLPDQEKQYILGNLTTYLYGTELPDNGAALDGIGDTVKHHVYYFANGSLQDDAAAVRASEEYNNSLNFLKANDYANAAKSAGVMSHYIADMAVFGHVMATETDWGPEIHHSDYETYVNERTSNYSGEFNSYLSYDGSLTSTSAYDAAKNLAYDTTFDIDGNLTCVWMDQNYDWSNPIFKDRAGESLNLAVNYLADVLHTLYLDAPPQTTTISVPRDYPTIQDAINAASEGSIVQVERGIYDPVIINKSLSIIGESVDNTIIDGKGTGAVIRITADNVYIRNFKIQNGNIGVNISDSKRNVVMSNVITNNDCGVFLSNCTESTIVGNVIRDNNYGISLDTSNGNTITRNTASRNLYGIDLRYCQNNTVDCNDLASNANDGLRLYHCDRNFVKRNIMRLNGGNGVYLQHSFDNVIFHNNFDNNTNQVYQYDSSNTWFSYVERSVQHEYPEGNYWSDYAGADTNGDGVGDTLLPHHEVDNYPLMEPWSPYPVAHFTCDPPIQMVDKLVVFNASASYDEDGSIVLFTWDFGDTNVTSLKDKVVTHSYATFGDYEVTLTVSDNDGLINFFSAHVTICNIPTASFTYYPESPRVGQSVTFNASLSAPKGGVIMNYSWDFETDGVIDACGMIATHTYASHGTYSVTLNVTNDGGLSGFSTVPLTVYTNPTATFTYYPESPTVGETVTFNASLSTPNGGTITSYSWDFEADGVVDAYGVIVNHAYSSPGSYTVTLTVTNDGGLTHTTAANVSVASATTGFVGWWQSPTVIAILVVGTAAIAVGAPLMLIKRRKPPSPLAAPPMPSLPPPYIPPSPTRRQEKPPKAVFTVSKTNGEYTVMIEGPENYPIKLKHQLKVDEAMKRDLVRDFDTTALIASYWNLSRSGAPKEKLPKVRTLDLITHLERSGRLMYRYLTPPNMGRFFKSARVDYLWLEIDENLLEIPWELMHDGKDFICLEYAVGRRILTQQLYEAKPPRIVDKPRFLLIGDPSEELPDAEKEIQLLKKHLESLPNIEVNTFLGSEMTKRDFLQTLSEGKYDCIHFAGHAGFNVGKPDESFLKFGDAPCYAFEAKRLIDEENPPEIVFVNACSSAKEEGQTTFEKDIGGLARSFLFKGSMGYIGALWPVHDEAVARLSVSLYTKLISGLTVGEALRQARKESFLMHKGKEIAWASFTLYGDPSLKLF